jgi:hypothetical protein
MSEETTFINENRVGCGGGLVGGESLYALDIVPHALIPKDDWKLRAPDISVFSPVRRFVLEFGRNRYGIILPYECQVTVNDLTTAREERKMVKDPIRQSLGLDDGPQPFLDSPHNVALHVEPMVAVVVSKPHDNFFKQRRTVFHSKPPSPDGP